MIESPPSDDVDDAHDVDDTPKIAVAPIGPRLLAYLVDVALLATVIQAVHFGVMRFAFGGERPAWADRGIVVWIVVLGTVSLPVYLYFALLESGRRRATLGKRLARIEVVGDDGAPIRFPRAFLRTLVKLIPWEVAHATMLLPKPLWAADAEAVARPGFMFSTLLVGAWLVTLMLTPRSQSVHDLVVRTLVVPRREEEGARR